jgi:hypothetical protein
MKVTVEPLSTCERELLRRWWQPISLMVSFMILQRQSGIFWVPSSINWKSPPHIGSLSAVSCLTDNLVYFSCDPIFFPEIDNSTNVTKHKVSSSRAVESYTHFVGSIAWWHLEVPAAKKKMV